MGKRSNRRHKLTRHHRLPKSMGGSNSPNNIAFISNERHSAWHFLFANLPAESICYLINKFYIDPAYKVVLVKNEKVL